MTELDDSIINSFDEDDHRVAYIFSSTDTSSTSASATTSRPTKRRKVISKPTTTSTKKSGSAAAFSANAAIPFPPLLSGQESQVAASLRQKTYETVWPVLEEKIESVLRNANKHTLEEVETFFSSAPADSNKIPAGFVITGPNIASQDLLFEQLAERLAGNDGARVVRLRAAEAGNLKAGLKKVIGGVVGGDGDEEREKDKGRRKYLDYDLEGLHAFLKRDGEEREGKVVVMFQDSEAFDVGVLGEMIGLFHSWNDRIHFSVVFGIATSVELFQARLLKSTARQLHGAQFDVVQANSVLESVIMTAVAGMDAKLRIGPSLLSQLVRRQQEQVAGIQVFVSALKYIYMNHFYANLLSVLLANDGNVDRKVLQPEHLEAIRMLDSFKTHVELAVKAGQLSHAHSLLEDDGYLIDQILEQGEKRKEYLTQLLRSLHLIMATGLLTKPFDELYEASLEAGIDLNRSPGPFDIGDSIRGLSPDEFLALIVRITSAIHSGSPELGLPGWEDDAEELIGSLTELRDEVEGLLELSKDNNATLKSKYSAQSKVLRTTVVAQKVQLSRDTATMTEQDKDFTSAIDKLVALLFQTADCERISSLFLHEVWQYDFRSPYEDVFVPRPGATFARALSRPHDYLGCSCCEKANGTIAPTLPTTSILYQLYFEAGSLINVADLWSSYYALVGDESEIGMDERSALVEFYRGLAELRAMGFVKQSKKKADHIAKLKWL
ncbi:origin recognition complex subunit 3 N-terminus-domain-containing protein [Podospora fimiseda]|uniref:Origin recognition complex subunit 3 N-terminus-domain-containing protein n=1 Tax=Podospora fimiseda TaxID=252190 RepID=A0AAN7BPN2_9PEZI|nr:origin recognition complex subunit 3 N-terminus-domain-containing protein [Podospora fimiseda]